MGQLTRPEQISQLKRRAWFYTHQTCSVTHTQFTLAFTLINMTSHVSSWIGYTQLTKFEDFREMLLKMYALD